MSNPDFTAGESPSQNLTLLPGRPEGGARLVRNTAKIGAGLVFSRLLGLLRDVLLAMTLGGGWVADIFLVAFRIPNFTRRIFYEGSVALAFIPYFNKLRLQQGPAEAFAFGRAAIWQFLAIALVFALLCIYASDSLALILAPGFADSPMLIELAGQLMRISFMYLPLVVVATLVSGMLLALERYTGPSISPACVNIAMIFAGVLVITGRYSGYRAAEIFCYGLLAGGALQILIQLPRLYKEGFRLFGKFSFHSRESRSFARSAPQAVFGAAAYQLGVVISMLMASFLGEGNVSALYFAERIIELPLAVAGIALGLVSVNSFTRLALRGHKDELNRQLGKVLSLGLLFSLPATFGALALAWPIMAALFGHGSFSNYTLDLTVTALVYYAPLLPALVMARPMLAALNACGKAFFTMLLAICSLALLVGCNLLLFNFTSLGLEAVTISANVSVWFNTLGLALMLRRTGVCSPRTPFFPWKSLLSYLAFSLVMFGLLILTQYGAVQAGLGGVARAALGVPLGLLVFFALCGLFYRQDLGLLKRAFSRG
ncbi:MAG: murein biosynthesis integral membrane protein MurJ [Deltaproteobacteria bacterium]|jgi:putative peptidoglycan lipid II flippase|nr:murein biosynthesis integral membrane protein MurJ [Deltaproteobacteria bacterium]